MSESYNIYNRELSEDEIRSGLHRELVGGMWDELGELQLYFLRDEGLAPSDTFLDIGCGPLRGGLWFIEYLDPGNYFGIDINQSFISAGKIELNRAALSSKNPNLLVDDRFSFSRFQSSFDFALAHSVFTHLPMNHIINCLIEIRKVLKPGGEFFATFFESPRSAYAEPLPHHPGGITTFLDRDPFHYSFADFQWMAGITGMALRYIGDWDHPRDQKMLGFKLANG